LGNSLQQKKTASLSRERGERFSLAGTKQTLHLAQIEGERESPGLGLGGKKAAQRCRTLKKQKLRPIKGQARQIDDGRKREAGQAGTGNHHKKPNPMTPTQGQEEDQKWAEETAGETRKELGGS